MRSFLLCLLVAAALVSTAGWTQFLEDTVEFNAASVGGMQPIPQQPQQPSVSQPSGLGFGFEDYEQPSSAFAPGTPPAGGAMPTPLEQRVAVIRGKWVFDAVTGRRLDAPELTSDLNSNRTHYSNDGQTLGDAIADDEYYSHVETIDSQYIGPETHTLILWYINMLRLLHSLDPLDFAGVGVASPDPVSPLPQMDIFAAQRDGKVTDWNERFLYDFRQMDPIEQRVLPRGEFYEIYVPPPPFAQPVRPDPTLAIPPTDFLQQAWVAYMGGTPDVNQITSVRGSAQGGSYRGGPPSVRGEELIGGSSEREWGGQSQYMYPALR